jgi:putative SOS response-associated peptidase YedK
MSGAYSTACCDVHVCTNRGETVLEKPSFRAISAASGSRRCVVVTSGYFEWHTTEALGPVRGRPPPRKIPYLIKHTDLGKPMLLAGVYDIWTGNGDKMHSFAIVTLDSTLKIDWLHDRMPVVLPSEESVRIWLSVDYSAADACDLIFREARATTDFTWTRMVKDLSKPVPLEEQGKPKPNVKVAVIDSFFSSSPRGAKRKVKSSATAHSPVAKIESKAARNSAPDPPSVSPSSPAKTQRPTKRRLVGEATIIVDGDDDNVPASSSNWDRQQRLPSKAQPVGRSPRQATQKAPSRKQANIQSFFTRP